MTEFRVRRARWPDDMPALKTVREQVFVLEQHVPADLEWDGLDEACTHALGEDAAGKPIATGRMKADGKIGRIAVLQTWRGKQVGNAIMAELIAAAREQRLAECYLDSQISALGFYQKLGFIEEGEEFMDAGIPHLRMRLKLS